jgi:hypothetical protein
MATTTTNYGWAIPTSTDLVKDGATAIATLGSAIDTSVNTALGTKKAGMVLLNTTSFSGVSSVSLATNTFTSAYTNYEIIVNGQIENFASVRLRKAGTDATGANYLIRGQYSTGVSSPALQTYWSMSNSTGTYKNGQLKFTLFSPLVNQLTYIQTGIMLGEQAGGNVYYFMAGQHQVVDTYDACTIAFNTAISGSYQVYGYNI